MIREAEPRNGKNNTTEIRNNGSEDVAEHNICLMLLSKTGFKAANFFATLLQNGWINYVTRFTDHARSNLSWNKSVCCELDEY